MTTDLDSWFQYIKFIKKLEHHVSPRITIKPVNKQLNPLGNPARERLLNSFKIPVLPPTIAKKRNPPVSIEASIDLHGLTQPQAFLKLKNSLEQAYNTNKKHILIITGKGALDKPGVIKLAAPRWLEYTELSQYIKNYSTAKNHLGGEGAILVTIKNKGTL